MRRRQSTEEQNTNSNQGMTTSKDDPADSVSASSSKKAAGKKRNRRRRRRQQANAKMNNTEEDSSSSLKSPLPRVVQAGSSVVDSDLDDASQVGGGTGERPPRRGRYLALALTLWVAEFILVIVLKRAGLIEPEFRLEEAVVNNVLPHLEQSFWRLNESIPLSYLTMEKKRPGFQLAQQGAVANYPVVLVPGFVTSGLEVWGGKECARKHFRQRLWAAIGGARSFLLERDCWREHMMLDIATGGDPEDIRLRAAEGFEAADYFLGNYWVFGKLIENLADVGYDSSTMTMEPYDWRLAFPVLEQRDGYLTKLKLKIEAMHKTNGKKVVLTSHSMGAQLMHYFFAWVTTSETRGGGGGGKKWVDEHVHAYVNIAGSHLGVPKAATSLLSGEMSDTVFGGTVGQVVENFFPRRLRKDLWTSWGSLWAMLPKGGDALWGVGADLCTERSADDPFCSKSGISPLVVMTEPPKAKDGAETISNLSDNVTPSTPVEETTNTNNITPTAPVDSLPNNGNTVDTAGDKSDKPKTQLSPSMHDFLSRQSHSLTELLDFLQAWGGGLGPDIANAKLHSLHGKDNSSPKTWHDPSRTPLPHAPNVRIYCMYGTGIETERAYYYKRNHEDQASSDGLEAPHDTSEPPVILNADVLSPEQHVNFGVRFSDGDGSVPLLSLGYLCADAWTRKDSGLNPSGAKVVTREYKHRAEFWVDDPMRSGPASADHVDILGNLDMMEDFLRVVTDFETSTIQENRIVSDIESIAKQINEQPGGGIFKRKRW